MNKINFRTYQEELCQGSTRPNTEYERNPYTPISVLDGLISVEECNELRKKNQNLKVYTFYWGAKGMSGVAKISELDTDSASRNYGQTLYDPILIQTDNDDYQNDNRNSVHWRDGPKVELLERTVSNLK